MPAPEVESTLLADDFFFGIGELAGEVAGLGLRVGVAGVLGTEDAAVSAESVRCMRTGRRSEDERLTGVLFACWVLVGVGGTDDLFGDEASVNEMDVGDATIGPPVWMGGGGAARTGALVSSV